MPTARVVPGGQAALTRDSPGSRMSNSASAMTGALRVRPGLRVGAASSCRRPRPGSDRSSGPPPARARPRRRPAGCGPQRRAPPPASPPACARAPRRPARPRGASSSAVRASISPSRSSIISISSSWGTGSFCFDPSAVRRCVPSSVPTSMPASASRYSARRTGSRSVFQAWFSCTIRCSDARRARASARANRSGCSCRVSSLYRRSSAARSTSNAAGTPSTWKCVGRGVGRLDGPAVRRRTCPRPRPSHTTSRSRTLARSAQNWTLSPQPQLPLAFGFTHLKPRAISVVA